MLIIIIFFLLMVTIVYYILIKRDDQNQIEKFINVENLIEENVLYDSPTVNDKIGFIDYAKVLAQSINNSINFTVYGIYGPWGSGKTSLMRMVKSELPNQTNIWFDAWKYNGKVSIFDALCEILGERLEQELKNRESRKKTEELINIECQNKKINYSIKKINNYKQNMSMIVNYLNSVSNSKIVIYVDDLDRCNPADAIDFLENLKVFFDVPRISFVIGVNYDILFFEINKRFKNLAKRNKNFTEEYLAKIINIPFFIPMLDQAKIKEYICYNIQDENVLKAVEVFSTGVEGNLRTVKRIVNTFIILNEVASIRKVNINPILLAKLLVIQYRYKDVYNLILLNPQYLIQIQNNLLRKNRTRAGLYSVDMERIPEEVKRILLISPYFKISELNIYLCLTIEKQNEMVTDVEAQQQNYLTKIKDGKLYEVPDLRILSPDIRQEVIDSIVRNFSKYVIEQQKKALELLEGVFDNNIKKSLLDILKEELLDVSVIIKILLVLKNNDINIETYVWKLLYDFAEYTEEQKECVLEFVVKLLDEGQRYCIDILDKMFDRIDWVSDEELKVRVVRSLGNSHDNKAIDLINNFMDDIDPEVVQSAFDAIGNLDVDALWDYYEKYTLDSNYRGAFFEAIVNHVEKTDTIISLIDYKTIIDFLNVEVDENGQIAEINLLYYVAMNIIDGENQIYYRVTSELKDILQNILNCLMYIARYNDKWTVRAEAEKVRERIEKYKEENYN